MATPTSIPVDKLARLVGTPGCPPLLDVRTDEDFAADPHLIPGAGRRPWRDPASWAGALAGRAAIVICRSGRTLSHGVAAWLRQAGVPAESLEGGSEAWRAAGLPMVPQAKLPPRDAEGRTVWVTRTRPKIDRIACPWLIRRFADPAAQFLFVPPAEVEAVAEQFGGAPFDIDGPGVFWSHRGESCTFDVLLDELALGTAPLRRLASIVRGADTARLDLAPEASGLLAASLGLSRLYADDLAQLDAGMLLYDAFYRWCRDATDETHNWPTNRPRPGG
ncbi:chromate resistance protein ChrB domain-containing protein [Methylobacterium sp. WSM2598]|uniref:chromate resistance protein ChrB domain-containing protein n=1 Tax=Methylobacterium sp. WSM2598 TaxID=398261 RepID=UPI00036D7F33|nr:sulfurtransferase/chromate resistance protein [Methylobacterium sp. WSM2598]